MTEGYRRSAQANMDRYQQQVELLGLSQREQEIIKGTGEIEKRYADQAAALEDKKKTAKGATLALINKELKNLEQLKQSELDIFMITMDQLDAYRRQQQEARNLIALEEERAEIAREIAAFQTQIDQAIRSAYEQVRAQKEGLALAEQRDQLERSIALLRGTDQDTIRKIFDLEQQRLTALKQIADIQNLPYEERLRREQEINDLYAQRRAAIESNYQLELVNQDNFVKGWQDAFTKWRNNLKTDAEIAADAFSTVTRGFEDSIVRFVQTGKLSFRSLFNDLIAQAVRASANRLLMGILTGMSGSPIGNFFGSLFGGGRAAGGPVTAGTPYVVGERGPELFVPQNTGKIIPNNKLTAAAPPQILTTNVNYNIQAVDASSFRSLVARDPEFIFNVTEQGRRQLPSRSRR
jgi:lambda family phage tail tape measure protein